MKKTINIKNRVFKIILEKDKTGGYTERRQYNH